eukprot:4282998-Prymnesium_polylepis.1
MALLAASLMMAAAILRAPTLPFSLCSHTGEETVSRCMGVEHGVAGCIADDGCSRSPCSHAGEEA